MGNDSVTDPNASDASAADSATDGAHSTDGAAHDGASDAPNDAVITDANARDVVTRDANRAGYWFVTSATYPTNSAPPAGLASVTDGDALCLLAAEQGALTVLHGRAWKAWLGDISTSAADHVTDGGLPVYQRPDGLVLGSLTQLENAGSVALPNAPDIDENGKAANGATVWTATHSSGSIDNSCNGWTSNSSSDNAMTGTSSQTSALWTHDSNKNCNVTEAIYCVEQL
jgi:hypothetical protein